MQESQSAITEVLALLKDCAQKRDISRGKALHETVIQDGLQTNKYISGALINMYSKCSCMPDAKALFDAMPYKNVVQWTSLIQGHVENGECSVALDLFANMDCQPNSVTLIVIVKACLGLLAKNQLDKTQCMLKGVAIQRQAKELGLEEDVFLASTFVDMYGKCGCMPRAREVFTKMKRRNAVSWNALLMGYVDNGQGEAALDCFRSRDCEPEPVSFVAGLKACAFLSRRLAKEFCLERGIELHKQAKDYGLDTHLVVENTLIDMYTKCGSLQHAEAVLARKKSVDCVSINILMLGYVSYGETLKAFDLFTCMDDCQPDPVTFVAALKALKDTKQFDKEFRLEKGMDVHKLAMQQRVDTELFVGNTLVDMYGKAGSLEHAQATFHGLVHSNVVSWNNLILAYVENEKSLAALDLFFTMDCEPDSVTFVAALKACSGLAASEPPLKEEFCFEMGMVVHRNAEQRGLLSDVFVANALVDMYTQCGVMRHARSVFSSMIIRDTVSWNILLLGYVENGESSVALDLFASKDCESDSVTYVAALKACTCLIANGRVSKQFCLERGVCIHKQFMLRDDFSGDIFVSNTLIDMYGKCGCMILARAVFDCMLARDVVSWSSLMLGYVENGESVEALELFTSMTCEPNHVTFVAALKACGSTGAVIVGEKIHSQIRKLGLDENQAVATSLVDFYGKCGMMEAASEVFDRMQVHDVVAWTALVAGYSLMGEAGQVFKVLERMHEAGEQPNDVTYQSILTACSHVGNVEQGKMYLECMVSNGVCPSKEHYVCLIDMFGRANRLHEALQVMESMPCQLNPVGWTSLLAACRKWNNEEIGRIAFSAIHDDRASADPLCPSSLSNRASGLLSEHSVL